VYDHLIKKVEELLIRSEQFEQRLKNIEKELLTPNEIREELGIKKINK
jgi:hypothetical protein